MNLPDRHYFGQSAKLWCVGRNEVKSEERRNDDQGQAGQWEGEEEEGGVEEKREGKGEEREKESIRGLGLVGR